MLSCFFRDPTVERAVGAVELLFMLKNGIPRLIDQASISKEDGMLVP